MTQLVLTREESWEGKHASDVALSCLADGQLAAVPDDARVHAESCPECLVKLGQFAVLSQEVGYALAERQARTHRFPIAIVGGAAFVAAAGALPAALDLVPRVVPWIFAVPRLVPLLTTSIVAVLHEIGSGPVGPVVSVASAASLSLLGYAVARTSRASGPKKV